MKIGVIGSINMDMCVETEKIPLKGETVHGSRISYSAGGKGANQAVAMSRLGADVIMFGMVGKDSYGYTMTEKLKNEKIDISNIVKKEDTSTGLAIITLAENDNTIVVVGGANTCVNTDYIDSISDKLLECDCILLQHEIPQETVLYAIDFCYKNNIKTILNPAPAREVPIEYIEKVTFITPNEHEAKILFGDNDSIEQIMKKYPHKLIVTQGAKGVSYADTNGEIITVPSIKANVVDTTGAGDTLNGAFAVALMSEKSVGDALKFANTAAGISIEKNGAQGGMPTSDEVFKRLSQSV